MKISDCKYFLVILSICMIFNSKFAHKSVQLQFYEWDSFRK